jgi:parvulin-like peptidyl-prolyl isomerase
MAEPPSRISGAELETLVRRMELMPQLLRRQQEDQIVDLVPFEEDWIAEQRSQVLVESSLEQFLEGRGWTEADFDLHLRRQEALLRFARQRFGPGLEERFLEAQGGRDEVIYSLLRVRDPGLARELWIRLEEGEVSFAEAAQQFSEGPESHRKGVMGPMQIGVLQPQELAQWLRALRPGEISAPRAIGEWQVLVRLEKLTPARFDDAMRQTLLQEELDRFLQQRVQQCLAGEPLEQLHYDPSA